MDDKPNKMPPEKVIVDTPATTALSVDTTTASVYSESTRAAPTRIRRNESVLVQRGLLQHQVYVFGLLSTGSFGAFLVYALPFSALMALACFVASTMALVYMVYRIVLLEVGNILETRGIGDYLPDSIYQQLTITSLHEWMMDSSFFLENRYLLLYFIPGITQQQLDSYLERLPARHQYVLVRPGLGQFFGSNFMRIVMGQSRYNDLLLEDSREEEIIQHAPRQLFPQEQENNNDLNSVFSLDLSEGDLGMNALGMANGAGQQQAAGMPNDNSQQQRQVVVAPQPVSCGPEDIPEEELEQEYNQESDILTEAVAAMTTSYSTMVTTAATGYAFQAVDYMSSIVIGTGATVTLGAVSIGVWGWWVGVYHPSRTTASLRAPHFPAQSSLVSTAFYGGASAAVMLLLRTTIRYTIKSQRESTSDSTTKPSDDEKKKK
jgi:hypothetical protein